MSVQSLHQTKLWVGRVALGPRLFLPYRLHILGCSTLMLLRSIPGGPGTCSPARRPAPSPSSCRPVAGRVLLHAHSYFPTSPEHVPSSTTALSFTYIHAHTYTFINTSTHTCTIIPTYMHIHTLTYILICVTYMHICTQYAHIYAHILHTEHIYNSPIHTHICKNTHTHMYTFTRYTHR